VTIYRFDRAAHALPYATGLCTNAVRETQHTFSASKQMTDTTSGPQPWINSLRHLARNAAAHAERDAIGAFAIGGCWKEKPDLLARACC
jgi:hypothetical protein